MLKRLVTLLLAVQLVVFGGTAAFAETSTSSNQNQDSSVNVDQNQSVNSGGTADEITQNQEKESDYSQNQNGNEQEQTTNVSANQNQTVTGAEKVDADQEQDVTLDSSQSQQVNDKNNNQNTEITTEQDQSVTAESDTDYVEQNQSTEIKTEQDSSNYPNQKTEVTTKEDQTVQTEGSATLEQSQKVKAEGTDNNKSGGIEAGTQNKVEIIKEAAQTIIKICQAILVNGQLVKDFQGEFVLGNDGIEKSQESYHSFSWGTLYILNKALISKIGEDGTEAFMESLIKLNFVSPKEPEYDWDNEDDDRDGLTNGEEVRLGTNPDKQDTDGDGISDYLEVRKFKTNPLNIDSDGDGLTDLFEVIYHDSVKIELSKAIKMEFSQLTYILASITDYSPKELNPLNKDTNGNEVTDNKEDFDQDGMNNEEEQDKGTNPHKADK
ncbi:hypothetical protein IM538_21450 [Cytobacillus suaedae]|nr:hypothetical protein IM538_21450 [Cytobacillus suaedae]